MKTLDNPTISVVSPVYKAEDCILELHQRLTKILGGITQKYEIILVEDCGGDRSWELIQELASKDKKIKGIKLSRNFGQHRAITAGLVHAKGDYIVVMDCDLQDQPEEIERLYSKILEGYDIVVGSRKERRDSYLKRLSSKWFYRIYSYASGVSMDSKVTNFGIYSKKVIDNFLKLKEQHRFFPIAIKWLGFKSIAIDVEHSKRFSGKSSYTLSKLLNAAFDNLISTSGKPLLIMFKFGLLASFISFIIGISIIIKWAMGDSPIHGWTSLIVSLNFIGGIIIMSIGIVGVYIQKMFEEMKKRPLYIIDQLLNMEVNNERF